MLNFNAKDFYITITSMRWNQAWLLAHKEAIGEDAWHKPISGEFVAELSKHLSEMEVSLGTIGANVSLIAVKRMQKDLAESGVTCAAYETSVQELGQRIVDELSLVKLFFLEEGKEKYFSSAEPLFGLEVQSKFPSTAAYEIDEAAKCIALSRDTAAVFHLMRVMEVAIKATAACLGIPDPAKPAERNWGFILKAIRDAIAGRNSSGGTPWTLPADREFFESVYASLDAVRTAWRNTTMHVENKYSSDEAEHIFVAVKGFMRKLASRMDEQGQPLA